METNKILNYNEVYSNAYLKGHEQVDQFINAEVSTNADIINKNNSTQKIKTAIKLGNENVEKTVRKNHHREETVLVQIH